MFDMIKSRDKENNTFVCVENAGRSQMADDSLENMLRGF
jgi:protein-tyrosine-phosphatase